jgi:hypothetical protein
MSAFGPKQTRLLDCICPLSRLKQTWRHVGHATAGELDRRKTSRDAAQAAGEGGKKKTASEGPLTVSEKSPLITASHIDFYPFQPLVTK